MKHHGSFSNKNKGDAWGPVMCVLCIISITSIIITGQHTTLFSHLPLYIDNSKSTMAVETVYMAINFLLGGAVWGCTNAILAQPTSKAAEEEMTTTDKTDMFSSLKSLARKKVRETKVCTVGP